MSEQKLSDNMIHILDEIAVAFKGSLEGPKSVKKRPPVYPYMNLFRIMRKHLQSCSEERHLLVNLCVGVELVNEKGILLI